MLKLSLDEHHDQQNARGGALSSSSSIVWCKLCKIQSLVLLLMLMQALPSVDGGNNDVMRFSRMKKKTQH